MSQSEKSSNQKLLFMLMDPKTQLNTVTGLLLPLALVQKIEPLGIKTYGDISTLTEQKLNDLPLMIAEKNAINSLRKRIPEKGKYPSEVQQID
jgi:hypothetical protein